MKTFFTFGYLIVLLSFCSSQTTDIDWNDHDVHTGVEQFLDALASETRKMLADQNAKIEELEQKLFTQIAKLDQQKSEIYLLKARMSAQKRIQLQEKAWMKSGMKRLEIQQNILREKQSTLETSINNSVTDPNSLNPLLQTFPESIHEALRDIERNLSRCCKKFDVTCRRPLPKRNSFIESNDKATYTHLDVIRFACKTGYILEGADRLSCQSDGYWSNKVPLCLRVECSRPKLATHRHTFIENSREKYRYQDNITFACLFVGMVLRGEKSLLCLSNGTWNGKPPVCRNARCSQPRLSRNVYILTQSRRQKRWYNYREQVTLYCGNGRALVGRKTLRCKSNGRWSGRSPSCRRLALCPNPKSSDPLLIIPPNAKNEYRSGDIVPFRCPPSYVIEGAYQIRCQYNGTWDNDSPKCIAGASGNFSVIDCQDVQAQGWTESGSYRVYPVPGGATDVYCDMETNGGGWTVFQHRFDGSVSFLRSWDDYANGFGNLNGEFWLGNNNIYRISSQSMYMLRLNLEDHHGVKRYASYSNFKVDSEQMNYQLTVEGYIGTAGDSLSYHNSKLFSTIDRDNDQVSKSCAHERLGAWWYGGCGNSNLNGLYIDRNDTDQKYMWWYHWPVTGQTNMKVTTMMMKRRPAVHKFDPPLHKNTNKRFFLLP